MIFPIPLPLLYVFFIGLGAVLITIYKLQEKGRIRVNTWAVKITLALILGYFIVEYLLPSVFRFMMFTINLYL